jgi:hypothetical protein
VAAASRFWRSFECMIPSTSRSLIIMDDVILNEANASYFLVRQFGSQRRGLGLGEVALACYFQE